MDALQTETTLAFPTACSSTVLPDPLTISQTASSPAATPATSTPSSRKDKTRRNVGRSAFPEIQTTWHAFTRLITPRNPGDPIDVHAAVILRGIPMFNPFLAIQTTDGGQQGQPGGEERYVVLDGKKEKVETAAWMLARIVAREIWRITGYRFIYKSRSGSSGNPTRHNSHFNCAQNDAEKRNKRSRVSIQKKRMPRFDCGGYLNIVTDERDLGTVNVVITHKLDHVRYAERPEAVDLQQAAWLVGLDARAEGGMAISAVAPNQENEMQWDVLDATGAGAGPSSRRSTVDGSGGERAEMEAPGHMIPTSQTLYELAQQSLATAAERGEAGSNSPAVVATGPSASTSATPNVDIVLDPRLAGDSGFHFLSPETSQHAGPSSAPLNRRMDASTSSGLQALPPTSALPASVSPAAPLLTMQQEGTMLLSDTVGDQSQRQPSKDRNTASASTEQPERVHITPDEYLRYQRAYQVILSQLTSSRGMETKRYEKVGPMLQWIEQVAKIFEGESSGGR
ncbi:hypothetical protein QFC24_000009 [Naganishia onofrii]|uniref:Uncharacterized protein n=1 Tax=Naganishia onofrii TaxID=1851511 RepID=A0ACC2XWG7_9TREE|nr:hypothetical protein QFC24_000009 [Naganishia onofrii]